MKQQDHRLNFLCPKKHLCSLAKVKSLFGAHEICRPGCDAINENCSLTFVFVRYKHNSVGTSGRSDPPPPFCETRDRREDWWGNILHPRGCTGAWPHMIGLVAPSNDLRTLERKAHFISSDIITFVFACLFCSVTVHLFFYEKLKIKKIN